MGIIPKATIIEFNGLPGVGKSTITHCLEDLAYRQGVPFYKDYHRHPFERKAVSLFFRPFLFGLLPPVLHYANCYGGGFQKYRYVAGLLSYVREYGDFLKDNKDGLLVIDQGIVQDFISIAHDSDIKQVKLISSIIEKIEKRDVHFIRIDCDLSEEIVLRRLRNRIDGGSRIEKNEDAEVMRLLSIQKNNLESVRQELDALPFSSRIIIDASVSPCDNACLIWDTIYETSEK